MNQRMKILAILLAGSITLGSAGMLHAEPTEQQNAKMSVAGISGAFSTMLEEKREFINKDKIWMTALDAVEQNDPRAVSRENGGADVAEVVEHEADTVTSEYTDIAIAQVNNYVNVRQEPNTESEVLGKLYDKSAATVLSATEDGWYEISSGSVNGYVKAEYVVVGDEELARSVSTRLATVTTTTLFVRKEPTTESPVLTMLPEGDDLVVTDESTEGWAKVTTEEGDGYVSTDYVNLFTEYVHAESKEEEEARLAKEEAERQEAARAAEAARRARQEKERQAATQSQGKGNGNGGAGSSANNNAGSVSNGQAVVDYARQFLGNPYVYGGTSLTNGADCSGFVQSVYKAFGVSLPRNSAAQRNAGYAVSISNIQPGDLVCYSGHIGIYAGNNTLIHASNERTGITTTSPITYRPVIAVRRIF